MDGWVWVWVWDWVGWDLCAGLFYEHRFAMLIRRNIYLKRGNIFLKRIKLHEIGLIWIGG